MAERFAFRFNLWLHRQWRTHPWHLAGQLSGTAILIGAIVFWRGSWSPDFLFVIFFLMFALYGQAFAFASRIGTFVLFLVGPYVLILLAYRSLHPFLPYLAEHVHFSLMINFDRWLGHGTLPDVWLQHHLLKPHLMWYDVYFYVLYMVHLMIPFVFAIVVWKLAPRDYNRFIAAFLLMTYAGFLTYALFPAAPPWMASQMGYIPHIQQVGGRVVAVVGVHDFPSLLQRLGDNEVAALPSLHAAFPMLVWLFVRRTFGWRPAVWFSWYPVSMWIGVVYLGEHYVFDVLLGIIYAVAAFMVTNQVFDRYGATMRLRLARWRLRTVASAGGKLAEDR